MIAIVSINEYFYIYFIGIYLPKYPKHEYDRDNYITNPKLH
jgi:hypothetical protein